MWTSLEISLLEARRSHARRLTALVALISLAVAGLVFPGAPQADAQSSGPEVLIFDEELRPGFTNWSSASNDLASTEVSSSGAISLRADLAAGQRIFLGNYVRTEVPPNSELRFDVHGGDNATVTLAVAVRDADGRDGPTATVSASGGSWTTISVPFADLGDPATVGAISWEAADGGALSSIWLDDIRIVLVSGDEEPPADDPPADPPADEPPADDPPADDPPADDPPASGSSWTFEETFDGDPGAPSQALLPRTFDYMVTHRTHPKDQFDDPYPAYAADHGVDCAGPNPAISPLPSHSVQTSQSSNGDNPDESFFICKNHMMSSMGEVDPYSVSAFWPRQEFNFSNGGTLEFDVNINEGHTFRHWWEVMIVPRDQLRFGAGPVDSAIDETYPEDRIVLTWRRNVRGIKVGTGDIAPNGWMVNEEQFGQYDFAYWRDLHPEDLEPGEALNDRRDRRTMRVRIEGDQIVWGIQTQAGTFDEYVVDVPGGLPFERGLVVFKTHAYTPSKNNNTDFYTFHWDNIRFDGPAVAPYDSAWADVVDLQRNGDRAIGDSKTVTVNLDAVGPNPVLYGQLNQPVRGQVLLSINDGPPIAVTLDRYETADCYSNDWKSFRLELDPAWLQAGENTLTWSVGPRPACADQGIGIDGPGAWDGFSVKALHIQTG